jgi:DNA-binding IclR family transcriptional regulator
MNVSDEDVSRAQRAVQSIEVGGRLLLALAANPRPMLLKELSAQADLPPSRAHPYLVSYLRLGLVRQELDSGRYALGPAALQMGLTALHQLDPVQTVRPLSEALAAETGQAVAVAVWGNLGPTVIRMIDASRPLHVAMRAGTVMSPFDTATGRAFTGVLRTEQIADAMAAGALGYTGKSRPFVIQDHESSVHGAQDDLRQYGCVRAVGNPIPGVNAFAAPVYDHEGQLALVLTLLGHESAVDPDWASGMAAALRASAREASRQLGYGGRTVSAQR